MIIPIPLDFTSEGLGEMFEGDSADTCAGKFPLAEGLACTDPGARTAIGASGIFFIDFQNSSRFKGVRGKSGNHLLVCAILITC